jgi:hypothetical protein
MHGENCKMLMKEKKLGAFAYFSRIRGVCYLGGRNQEECGLRPF